MPTFQVGQEISTEEPSVQVDASVDAPLPKGRHIFRLVVVDDDGLESEPADVEVVVMDDRRPTAVVRAPTTVPFGQPFELDGRASTDLPPSKVVKYRWTLLR